MNEGKKGRESLGKPEKGKGEKWKGTGKEKGGWKDRTDVVRGEQGRRAHRRGDSKREGVGQGESKLGADKLGGGKFIIIIIIIIINSDNKLGRGGNHDRTGQRKPWEGGTVTGIRDTAGRGGVKDMLKVLESDERGKEDG